MISNSQCHFLNYVSSYLMNDIYSPPPNDVDWEDIFQIAVSQSMEAMLFRQTLCALPPETRRKYIRQYAGYGVISLQRESLFSEIVKMANACNISFVCTKGSVFRDYYDLPPVRSMGDIDIVIHEEDRASMDHIMTNVLGYDKFIDHHDCWTYWKGNVYIEIHTHMFYDPLANDYDYRSYFDQVWDHIHHAPVFGIESENLYIPDESFHFLYLMTHTAKHIVNKGSGFRPYVDMVLMCQKCQDKLDWDYITKELEKMQLLKFTKICFSLCERWFGVTMPLEKEPLDNAFFERVTEKTLNDGIFGFDNQENSSAGAAREIKRAEESGGSYSAGTVRLLLRKVFPPYRDMQLIPWYKFVDGRPWLLPAAWVYRWGYCLVHKGAASGKQLAEPFVRKKEIEERQDLLSSWGL